MSTEKPQSFFKGFEYRIFPTEEQKVYLAKVFGSCRFVYNRLLGNHNRSFQAFKEARELNPLLKFTEGSSGYDFAKKMTVIRNDPAYPWFLELPQRPLLRTSLDLGDAFKKFFKEKKGYPRFKKLSHKQSFSVEFGTGTNFYVKDGYLKLPKLDSLIKMRISRAIPEDMREITITKTPTGKYFAAILCKVEPKKTSGTGIIGVDLGITTLASFSDGSKFENPKHFLKYQLQLQRAQRKVSKKKPKSNKRKKTQLKVARLHEKIANTRKDCLHKLTTRLICENQAIGIETLNVAGMLKNRRLAKRIADAAFGMFRRMLCYKAIHSQHVLVVAADAYYGSTQTCSACRTVSEIKIKLGTRNWTCVNCGAYHDRDTNAAKNLEIMAMIGLKLTDKRDKTVIMPKGHGNKSH